MSRLDWMRDGLCQQVDPDLFFPEGHGSTRDAKRVCAVCPAQDPCLEYALTHKVDGIWAGTTPSQRRQMKGAAYRPLAS